MEKILSTLFIAFYTIGVDAQNIQWKDYMPEIHGTLRGKYEYQTTTNQQRFQVRTARVSVSGNIIVPFTIDAHRSPHLQYFANRSFIAKQMGSLRDAGATLKYVHRNGLPFSLEAGLFSGSGLTEQKGWHKSLSYSAKLELKPFKGYNLTLSTQRIRPTDKNIYMYDLGTYYDWNNWHFEVETMYKEYPNSSFKSVWAVNAFVNYDWFIRKKKNLFKKVSLLARFDYMGNNSDGTLDEQGEFLITDYERKRITSGLTFSFGKPFQADLRLNYEKYFYEDRSFALESEQDKLVVEMMVRF